MLFRSPAALRLLSFPVVRFFQSAFYLLHPVGPLSWFLPCFSSRRRLLWLSCCSAGGPLVDATCWRAVVAWTIRLLVLLFVLVVGALPLPAAGFPHGPAAVGRLVGVLSAVPATTHMMVLLLPALDWVFVVPASEPVVLRRPRADLPEAYLPAVLLACPHHNPATSNRPFHLFCPPFRSFVRSVHQRCPLLLVSTDIFSSNS